MEFGPLSFKPIELPLRADLCVRYREDSFAVSFGDAAGFHEADGRGAERYLSWLERKLADDVMSAVHVWLAGEIVGQMEFGRRSEMPGTGYVNLYYLDPARRERGLGRYLDEFARWYLKAKGHQRALLSVSPTNLRAVRFYERMGWKDIGPRPGRPQVHFMETAL